MPDGPDGSSFSRALAESRDAAWRAGLRVAYRLALAWWFVRRPRSVGAYVVVWHGERVLLVRNSYHPLETVPSGRVDRGETPRQAAARELFEEAGIRAAEADLVFARDFEVPFANKRDHAHFFDLVLDEAPEVRIDRREVVWAEFLTVPEIEARRLVPHLRAYLAWRRDA